MIGRHCSTNFLTSSTKDGLTSSISVKYRGMDDIRWDERTPHFQIESLKVFFFSIREMYFLKQTIIIILRTIMRKQSVLYACDMKNYRKPISLSVKAKSSQFSLLKFDNVLESLKQSNEARRTKKRQSSDIFVSFSGFGGDLVCKCFAETWSFGYYFHWWNQWSKSHLFDFNNTSVILPLSHPRATWELFLVSLKLLSISG